MLGPNRGAWRTWCNAEAVVFIPRMFWTIRRPVTYEDVQNILKLVKNIEQSIAQYETNVRMGVIAGMVWTLRECQAGITCLHTELGVQTFKTATDILKSSYIPPKNFLYEVSQEAHDKWIYEHSKSISISLNDFLVEYVGKPLVKLFDYLKEHNAFCLPNSAPRGMGTKPVNFIYNNGVATGNRTSKRLPTGELINGTRSYNQVLRYVTTNDDVTAGEYNIINVINNI